MEAFALGMRASAFQGYHLKMIIKVAFLGPLRASIFVNPFKDTDSGRFHQRYGSNHLTPCCPLIRQISRTEKVLGFFFMRNSRAEPNFSFGGLL